MSDEETRRSAAEYAERQREDSRRAWEDQQRAVRESSERWQAKREASSRAYEEARDKATRSREQFRKNREELWEALHPPSSKVRGFGGSRSTSGLSSYSSTGNGGGLFRTGILVIVVLGVLWFFSSGSKKSNNRDSSFDQHSDRTAEPKTTSRPQGKMQGNAAPAYADFSTPKIRGKNMNVMPGVAFVYNRGNWKLTAWAGGFTDTFVLPESGAYKLVVTHLSSLNDAPLRACRGNGYSPVTIQLNGGTVAAHYDAAENHGGSHHMVTDEWPILARAGQNTLQWTMNDACTQYWIQRIEVQAASLQQNARGS